MKCGCEPRRGYRCEEGKRLQKAVKRAYDEYSEARAMHPLTERQALRRLDAARAAVIAHRNARGT